jgi:hypothetical protein
MQVKQRAHRVHLCAGSPELPQHLGRLVGFPKMIQLPVEAGLAVRVESDGW